MKPGRARTLSGTRPPSPAAVAAALLVAVFSAGSLFAGADYISFLLPGGLPFGNVLAAGVLCGVSGAAMLIAPRNGMARRAALFALAASVAWLPLSIALAGNASLNFSGGLGTVWLWCSVGLFACVLGALTAAASAALLARRTQGGPD